MSQNPCPSSNSIDRRTLIGGAGGVERISLRGSLAGFTKQRGEGPGLIVSSAITARARWKLTLEGTFR